MSPDDEAAWREWQPRWVAGESRAGRLAGYTGNELQRAAFMAGRESGRADAAVQEQQRIVDDLRMMASAHPLGDAQTELSEFANSIVRRMNHAAQYREKGNRNER